MSTCMCVCVCQWMSKGLCRVCVCVCMPFAELDSGQRISVIQHYRFPSDRDLSLQVRMSVCVSVCVCVCVCILQSVILSKEFQSFSITDSLQIETSACR